MAAACVMLPLADVLDRGQYLYGRFWQRFGLLAYRADELVLAELALRQHLWATGQSDLIATRATTGCPNVATYELFEPLFGAFLGERRKAFEEGRSPLPRFVREQEPAPDPSILTERRAVIVTPHYIMSSERYIENDFIDHYTASLANAGVKTTQFFSDRIAYSDIFTLDPTKAAADIAELRGFVHESRPDVIILDANFVGGEIGLNASLLRDLKRAYGVKIVIVLSDAWGDHGLRAANYWGSVCDMIFHLAPGGAAERLSSAREKMFCSAPPVNERNFHIDPQTECDVSFFGSDGTYLRAFWFTTAKRTIARLGLSSNIRTHQRKSDCPSIEEYAAIMRTSRMVINGSSRSRGVHIATGRVWQALHSRVLLLEESNRETEHFFVPFVHYVPFENARQLAHLIEFFKKNADWATRIGAAGARFCAAHYTANEIWARVFARLVGTQGANTMRCR